MKRKTLIGISLALICSGVYMVVRLAGQGVETRVVSRTGHLIIEETTIHKVPFPEFVTHLRDQHPTWRVGFRDQTVTFTPPGRSTTYLSVSPGTYNPEPGWTDLGPSEGWSTLIEIRGRKWTDWLRPEVKPTGTMTVDIPLLYWGKRDKHGFALKLEKLPTWLSRIYEERTGLRPKPDAKVGTR